MFLITFLMQVAAGILICVTLYYSTPKTYLSTSDENYLKVFDLIKQLQSVCSENGLFSEGKWLRCHFSKASA